VHGSSVVALAAEIGSAEIATTIARKRRRTMTPKANRVTPID
jgi:hypothetical protein